jgi:hypothetical protein
MLLRNLERKINKAENELKKAGVKVEESFSENFITKRVLEMDSTPESTRVGRQYTHVSSLIGICTRRHILAHIHNLERVKSVLPAMRIVWALGRAAEAHVRGQFIDHVQRHGVIGTWVCKCGYLKTSGLYIDQPSCPRCRTKNSNYKELALFDHDCRITGSPDFLVVRPDNKKIMVVEFKSINKEDFSKLQAPKRDHVLQAMAYNELLRLNNCDPDTRITVVYISKDYQIGSPYKEFLIERTSEYETNINIMWQNALTISEAIKAHSTNKEVKIPAKLASCNTLDSSTVKSCDCAAICFAKG